MNNQTDSVFPNGRTEKITPENKSSLIDFLRKNFLNKQCVVSDGSHLKVVTFKDIDELDCPNCVHLSGDELFGDKTHLIFHVTETIDTKQGSWKYHGFSNIFDAGSGRKKLVTVNSQLPPDKTKWEKIVNGHQILIPE